VFQRAIATAGAVDGHNLQVLIQAAHPWLGRQGLQLLSGSGGCSEQIAPLN
jgi:hypothetical protein